ncbi:MAG: gliding motility-associated C-terminal domain-containing protein [Bacteroidales bacterium]
MDEEKIIFEQLKSRLKDYKEEPDRKIWQHIYRRLSKPYFNIIKFMTITGGFLIVAVIGALILAPTVTNNEMVNRKTNPVIVSTTNTSLSEGKTTTQQNSNNFIEEVSKPKQQSDYINNSNDTKNLNNSELKLDTVTKKTNGNEIKKEVSMTNPITKTYTAKIDERNDDDENIAVANSTQVPNKIPIADLIIDDKLIMPNAFQPNSNEDKVKVFKPAYRDVKTFEMKIFSRNGMQVFVSKDITYGWDGTIKGRAANNGTYIYYIKYEDTDGEVHRQKGTLWLYR